MRPVPRPKNHLDSFRYAVEGIVHTFRTQKHMRFHFFTVVLVLLISALLRMNRVEMAILFLVVSSVLIAEMLNTAIESVVDMVTQAYHPLAKLAKDIAAGAVLIAAINAVVVGIILFLKDRRIERLSLQIDHDPQPMNVIVTVTLLILIIVMLSKVIGGKGAILHGGIVSGHAAISFCLAATIMYRAADPMTTALAIGLALLVAQSRVEGKIHTLQEVIVGGLLGMFVTTLIYFVRVPL
ncbi:diacylglycerol kinase [Capsulimonas corticalis]|uniref:Diacylglycerol kinase n=1 Tax=Capsulimonas corticalis TaxID=2219043 RepID=A0A402CXT8_9BACT|nr:diacylglycerol kinase [Capsulimonas corticalis]BDI32173.1 diacylglycerol kinase [Capsulimonas corticalis]